jgi:hypothetical protein
MVILTALVMVGVSMIDPFTAGFGILAGWLARRSPPYAAGAGLLGAVVLVGFYVLSSRYLGDHIQPGLIAARLAALAAWAGIAYSMSKRRPQK